MEKKTLDPEALRVNGFTTTPAIAADDAAGPLPTRVTSCPGGPPFCTC